MPKTSNIFWFYLWMCLLRTNVVVEAATNDSLEFRLVGGTSNTNGRVEVKVQGEWGTVCDDGFGTYEAQVLCKSMGYPNKAAMAVSSGVYGLGSGRIWLDDFICTGQEANLDDCIHSPEGQTDCQQSESVGVVCTDVPHQYRLVQGISASSGRAEIYTGDRWVSISRANFDILAAKVLCRSLNLPHLNPMMLAYPEPSPNVWLESISCLGTETTLYECPSTLKAPQNWLNQSVAGVFCDDSLNTHSTTPRTPDNGETKLYFCPRTTDVRGTTWDEVAGGTTAVTPCISISDDLTGQVTRHCSAQGIWEDPAYDCTRKELHQLQQQIDAIRENVSVSVLEKTLTSLSAATQVADTQGGLYSGDISKAAEILDTVANVSDNVIITEQQSNSFIQVTGNLLDTRNQAAWKSIIEGAPGSSQDTGKKGKATQVLEVVGKYADAIAKTLDRTNEKERVVPNDNMILVVTKIETPKTIIFPSETTLQKLDMSPPRASFHLDKASVQGASSFSCVIYKDLTGILPSRIVNSSTNGQSNTDHLNSAVMAIQLNSNLTQHLPSPVVMQFNHLRANLIDAKCMFWNTVRRGWDNMGCRPKSSNSTYTVCECDHLTNFAILMSPWKEKSVSTKAIDMISYVGCSISLVCLILTVVLHAIFWRQLKPTFRSVILVNLSISLALVYGLFIFGVDKTKNKTVCTVIAGCLHYLLLVVFCNMLAESIDVAWIVIMPLEHKSRPKWTLLVAWMLPAIVVGISMGYRRLDGYGTKSYCWISVENGLIWAFVGPALLVILVNLIVLIVVVKIMCRTRAMQDKRISERVRSSLWCLLMLLPLTGCTWTVGMFYVEQDSAWTQYVFVVTNSLQGCIIFVCHCILNKQMAQAMRQSIRKHISSRASLSADTTSSSTIHIRNPLKSGAYAVSTTSNTKL